MKQFHSFFVFFLSKYLLMLAFSYLTQDFFFLEEMLSTWSNEFKIFLLLKLIIFTTVGQRFNDNEHTFVFDDLSTS